MLTLRAPGIVARFSPVGARLVSCVVDGVEMVFGNGLAEDVLKGDIYAGSVCGRHAGRVTNARFPLDGEVVQLVPNAINAPHQLHGGDGSTSFRRWDYLIEGNRIRFYLQSADGDQGFPGQMDIEAVYELHGAMLSLSIAAHSTRPTLCNITNHAYWNPAGGGSILDQQLMVAGDHYFPLGDLLLPKGRIDPVEGTAWDFRSLRKIANNYDGCIKLNGTRGVMKHGLTLRDPVSGRQIDVSTTEGCMQFYTAIHWGGDMHDATGALLPASGALAIEPQNIADAPNHPSFPSSILRPGETYRNAMRWAFS
jgi:aldose 1-epimerase